MSEIPEKVLELAKGWGEQKVMRAAPSELLKEACRGRVQAIEQALCSGRATLIRPFYIRSLS